MKTLARFFAAIACCRYNFDGGSSAASQAQSNQAANQQQAQNYFASMLQNALSGNAAYLKANPSPASTWGGIKAPGMVGPSSLGGGMTTGAAAPGTSGGPMSPIAAMLGRPSTGGRKA